MLSKTIGLASSQLNANDDGDENDYIECDANKNDKGDVDGYDDGNKKVFIEGDADDKDYIDAES